MTARNPVETSPNIYDELVGQAHDHRDTRQKDRYGGTNWGACFFGWLVAINVGAVLSGVAAALLTTRAGRWVVPRGQGELRLTAAGIVAALALIGVVVIAYYAGGYVAGRMSRFDGGTQGRGVWVVGLLLSGAAVSLVLLLRSRYGLFQWIDLPAVRDTVKGFGVASVFTAIAMLLSSLLAAIAGGKVGCGYHKKVDRAAE